MDMISRNNAKEALNNLKMEIAIELSYNYNWNIVSEHVENEEAE